MLRCNRLLAQQRLPMVMGPRVRGDDSGASCETIVGWVERSETHHLTARSIAMGFAALYPSYELLS
jgi:hypothetical protein